jgi:hypothetical protein
MMMKLSAKHFNPLKESRKKFFYSTRSNKLSRTQQVDACLYMKKKQSSLHNKVEELTSDSDCGACHFLINYLRSVEDMIQEIRK